MSHIDEEKWDKLVEEIRKDIPKFKLVDKETNLLSKVLSKLMFWADYMKFYTTIYPNVYLPKEKEKNTRSLQHEWVHLKDQKTFFGLLSFLPAKINLWLFSAVYFMPQVFALLAVLAIWNPWWLFCLLFLLPLPAVGRMIAEMRAYRRSKELKGIVDSIVGQFTKKNYYFMFPFKKLVLKLLKKDSPYKELMDKIK